MIVMKSLLLLLATLLAICGPTEQSNSSLIDIVNEISIDGVLRRIHHFNMELIHEVLIELGHDPDSVLSHYLPEALKIVEATLDRVGHCYDSSVGDNQVDIFHQPIAQIIASFFKEYSPSYIQDFEEAKLRIKNLLHYIIELAKSVIKCAFNTDPNFLPTKLGLTHFAVLSHAEFLEKNGNNFLDDESQYNEFGDDDENTAGLLGASVPEEGTKKILQYRPECQTNKTIERGEVPSKFDWRDYGVVTPIQNQGECNSCYIFATIGALESAYMIRHNGSKVKFNEQAYVNCYPKNCSGGHPPAVMLWAVKNGLTLAEKGDKYVGKVEKCKPTPIFESRPNNLCSKLNLTVKTKEEKELELEATISRYGPTVLQFDVTHPDIMKLGKSPWNTPCLDDPYGNNTKHAVLAVGYNETYWFIKNSWNTDWGMDGYLFLPKSIAEGCDIYKSAYVPRFDVKMNQNKTEQLNKYLSMANFTNFDEL